MIRRTFEIDGMRCGGCVRKVSSLLKTLPGVQVEEVSLGCATVRLDPTKTTQVQVIRALGLAGYSARVE